MLSLMKKCEQRLGATCEHLARYSVVYPDAARLALCDDHVAEVETVVQSVTPIRSLRTEAIEAQLSELAGAAVRILRHHPSGGLLLTGAVDVLSKACGYRSRHNDLRRMYFTRLTVRSMLAAAAARAA